MVQVPDTLALLRVARAAAEALPAVQFALRNAPNVAAVENYAIMLANLEHALSRLNLPEGEPR